MSCLPFISHPQRICVATLYQSTTLREILEAMASEKEKAGAVTSDPSDAIPPQAENDKAPAVEDDVEEFPDPDEDDLDDLDGKRSCCHFRWQGSH